MQQLLAIVAVMVVGVGCDAAPSEAGVPVDIVAIAGPTCPVVSEPPDPSCADRPVAGAVIIALPMFGDYYTPGVSLVRGEGVAEFDRLVTDVAGEATTELPAGTFTLEPQPVDGLLGTPRPMEVTIAADGDQAPIVIAYDTGIR